MAQSFSIKTTNIRSLAFEAIVTEFHITTNKQPELVERDFRYELAEYICVVNPNSRRGILAIIKKEYYS